MADVADYTVDGLLTAVRDAAGLASNTEATLNARLLRMLNREQGLYIATLLESAEAKHRTAALAIAVTASLTYDIPARAIAAGLIKLEGVDDNGQTWMLYEFNDEQRSRFWPRNGHFYVQGNQIIFYQPPPAGTLRFTYPLRMSQLVQTSAVGVIASISGPVVTISSEPNTFGSGQQYDLVRATPHFDILAMDQSALGSGTTWSFSGGLPAGLAKGDYMCLPGQTAVCQAPYEVHAVLANLVAFKLLRSKGDPRAADARADWKEAEASALTLLAPRIKREAPLSNPYAPGWASMTRGFRRS